MSFRLAPQVALAALVALGSALPASAQLVSVVPPTSPLGAWVPITMDNNTGTNHLVGQACPFEVRTLAGALVYDIDCPTLVPVPVPPGGVASFYWQQNDNTFQPVPAGTYVITVELPDGTLPAHTVVIGGSSGGVALLGVPRVGTTRGFFLQSPADPLETFVMGASTATSPGIPSCGGTIPLFPDAVLTLSLDPSNGVFLDFAGTLGTIGESWDPSLALPPNPGLVGFPLSFSYVTLDPFAPCLIDSIAAPLSTTIQA